MSINAMANLAMSRRPDFEPAGRPPHGSLEVAAASGFLPPHPVPSGTLAPIIPAGPEIGALQTLTTYIPTEIVTLYVAAVATLGGSKSAHPWLPFYCFLVGTPALVWIAFATKVKAAGKTLPWKWGKLPIWEMSAATIAFTVWAFALPQSPFATFAAWYSQSLAGFLILVVSFGLGAIAPLAQRPLSA